MSMYPSTEEHSGSVECWTWNPRVTCSRLTRGTDMEQISKFPQNVGPDLDPNHLTLIVFMKQFIEEVNFENCSSQQQKWECKGSVV